MAYEARSDLLPPSSSQFSPYSHSHLDPSSVGSLPKVHLGSFSPMDAASLFENVGRSPVGSPGVGGTPSESAAPTTRDGALRGGISNNNESGSPSAATNSLLRDISMSSEGRRMLQPRSSLPASTSTSDPSISPRGQQRQGSALSSPSSFMPSGSVATDTPPTLDEAVGALSTSSPVGMTDVVPSPPKSHPNSHSYLPPGAASPVIRSVSHYTPDANNAGSMAGISSGGGRTASGGYARSSVSPTTLQQDVHPASSSSTTKQDRPPSRPREQEQPAKERVDDGVAGPSRRQSPNAVKRRSIDQQPPPQATSPNPGSSSRRLEPEHPPNGLPDAGSPSRRTTSQYYSQHPPVTQVLPQNIQAPLQQKHAPPQQQQQQQQQPPPSQQPRYPPVQAEQPVVQTRPKLAPVVVEEVCIECMMRDRDMADVEVAADGVWERDSDADYRDLLRTEEEVEYRARMSGAPADYQQVSSKPRARGGPLTEDNVKVWLTMVSRITLAV